MAIVRGDQVIMAHHDTVIENGDLALVYGEWSLTGGTDPDGNPVNMEGRSTEIMRRQSDGQGCGGAATSASTKRGCSMWQLRQR